MELSKLRRLQKSLFAGINFRKICAFTLAEMMVVMLIMSVIMAAMAPVMTRKSRTDTSTPWKWSSIGSPHAYFGLNSSQTALIGQSTPAASDPSNKLTINATGNIRHILLKRGDSLATISLSSNGGLIYGNTSIDNVGENSISIGNGASANGSDSIAVGHDAGVANGVSEAIAIGHEAKAGSSSVSIGGSASKRNTTGSDNVAIGSQSMSKNSSGNSNVAMGYQSMNKNSTGSDNVAIGSQSMNSNTTGYSNVAMGYQSMFGNTTGHSNVVMGSQSMNGNTTGSNNVAIGVNSLLANSTGNLNVAIGSQSMNSNTTGNMNVAIGANSLLANATGKNNIAMGYASLFQNTAGDKNIAIGDYALGDNRVGSNNIAIGDRACYNVLGSNKTCIGNNSGPLNTEKWVRDDDNIERIFIGGKSLFNGLSAVLEIHNTRETGQIFKATSSDDDNSSETNGNLTSVVINGNLLVKGVIISTAAGGTSGTGRPGIVRPFSKNDDNVKNQDFWKAYSSDRRLKYVGAENKDGLAKLRQLKVFNYTFKKDEKKIPHVGVIAQDLQKVFPKAVIKGEDGFLSIRMEDMFYAVINAIKELDFRLKALEKENKLLKEQNKALEARLKALEDKIK